jgi:hypothetical protein
VPKPPITDPANPGVWACAENNPFFPLFPDPADVDPPEADLFAALDALRARDPINDPLTLDLADIFPAESERIDAAGRLMFHTVGCTGDPEVSAPQDAVADSMAAQLSAPADAPCFLFHLGDIVYRDKAAQPLPADAPDDGPAATGLEQLYREEFFQPYRGYDRPLFAIPGNHDGKYKRHNGPAGPVALKRSPMWHFLTHFCAKGAAAWPGNNAGAADPSQRTMCQPYPFFVLKTPVADLIGVCTNVVNGGALDDPAVGDPLGVNARQYQWLVGRLRHVAKKHEEARQAGQPPRALLLMAHYPPWSGTPNFAQRGDPACPLTPAPHPPMFLADVLLSAFRVAGAWPDAIFCAHAHLYQRITYHLGADDLGTPRQIPVIVIGSGGHASHGPDGQPAPESMWQSCDNSSASAPQTPPLHLILPEGYRLPETDTAEVAAYNDRDFGFVRITVDRVARTLTGEFFAAYPSSPSAAPAGASYVPARHDAFRLDLDTHRLR